VKTLQSVLTIDPEDLQAHYNLMLCYNGLGNEKLAKEHEARYMRFKADESSQAITGPYRQAHPEDNNERQAVHEHVSVPLPLLTMWGQLPRLSSRARLGQPSEPHDDFLSLETSLCLCVSVVIGLFLGNKPRPADPLPRRHRASRHPFHPQQWRVRKKVAAGNHGPGLRLYRLRQRRLPDIFLVNGTDWPNTPTPGQRLQSYTTTIATEPSAM